MASGAKYKHEVTNLMRIDDPGIVKLFESFEYELRGQLFHCLVMEYCDGGDLKDHIEKQKTPYSQEKISNVLLQITMALKVIHDHNMIHRDLKPENVFVMANGILKIGDFGLVKRPAYIRETWENVGGTRKYMAPEVLQNKKITTAVDIWALGCILFELMELKFAFGCGPYDREMECRIKCGAFGPLTHVDCHLFEKLLKSLLNIDDRQRPSADNILENDILGEARKRLNRAERLRQSSETCQNGRTTNNQDNLKQVLNVRDSQKYTVEQHLGKGRYGSVKLVRRECDLRLFAMKIVEIVDRSSIILPRASLTEPEEFKHVCLVTLINSFEYDDGESLYHCLLMEYCDGGTLNRLIASHCEHEVKFEEGEINDFLLQLVLALEYIQSKGIIHCDIEPQNIFLTKSRNLKLGQFGFMKSLRNTSYVSASISSAKSPYSAPEVLQTGRMSRYSDIWSLGCVLYELMKLRPPSDCGPNIAEVENQYSLELVEILTLLLNKVQSDRPLPGDILKKEIFKIPLQLWKLKQRDSTPAAASLQVDLRSGAH